MSVKNTAAAKAARREAKVERKSANALVSNYSPIKKLNMGKTNLDPDFDMPNKFR